MKWLVASFVLAFSLVSIWTGPGKPLGHAEEGLPFFNSRRTFNMYQNIWQDSGFGYVGLFFRPRLTLYGLAAALEASGLPSLRVQQVIFIALIMTPLVTVPYLARMLFPRSSGFTNKSAAMIYVFNLFVLSQVWQRFIYPLMFLWAYLPLFLYLWMGWLDTKRLKYLLGLGISSIVFSDSFGLVSSVIALWIPAGLMWLGSRRIIVGLVGFVVWLAANLWWWYPLVGVSSELGSVSGVSQNLVSLIDVSKFFANSDIWLLKQAYFFSPNSIWSSFYSAKAITYLSYGLIGLLALGGLSLVKHRKEIWIVAWLLIGWFLVKGANPPGGVEFYRWLFETLPFTVVLRNPYEKLGVVFLLPYSLLVAMGLSKLRYRIVRTAVLAVVCFVLVRPLWTGQVFAGYQVEVPASYTKANDHVNSYSNLRLLQLPFLHEAGVRYVWGYSGDELSDFLFDRPSLSKTYFYPNDPYPLIYKHMRNPKVYKLFQLVAIDSLVVHKDITPSQGYQENYEGATAMVKLIDNVYIDKALEDLDIYRLKPHVPVRWGYLSNRVWQVPTLAEGFSLVMNNDDFDPQLDSFVVNRPVDSLSSAEGVDYQIIKLSPVHYQFQISSASAPYLAILSVSYNQGWRAYIKDQEVKTHRQVNGFANGWLVDESGSYTIDVLFK